MSEQYPYLFLGKQWPATYLGYQMPNAWMYKYYKDHYQKYHVSEWDLKEATKDLKRNALTHIKLHERRVQQLRLTSEIILDVLRGEMWHQFTVAFMRHCETIIIMDSKLAQNNDVPTILFETAFKAEIDCLIPVTTYQSGDMSLDIQIQIQAKKQLYRKVDEGIKFYRKLLINWEGARYVALDDYFSRSKNEPTDFEDDYSKCSLVILLVSLADLYYYKAKYVDGSGHPKVGKCDMPLDYHIARDFYEKALDFVPDTYSLNYPYHIPYGTSIATGYVKEIKERIKFCEQSMLFHP